MYLTSLSERLFFRITKSKYYNTVRVIFTVGKKQFRIPLRSSSRAGVCLYQLPEKVDVS